MSEIAPAEIAGFDYRDNALHALLVTDQPGIAREHFGAGRDAIWVWPVSIRVLT